MCVWCSVCVCVEVCPSVNVMQRPEGQHIQCLPCCSLPCNKIHKINRKLIFVLGWQVGAHCQSNRRAHPILAYVDAGVSNPGTAPCPYPPTQHFVFDVLSRCAGTICISKVTENRFENSAHEKKRYEQHVSWKRLKLCCLNQSLMGVCGVDKVTVGKAQDQI